MPSKSMSPQDVRDRLIGGGELAILDLREQGTFGDRHLLFAVNVPLSRLELKIADFVPRRGTPVVLCSGGADDADLVTRGAERLAKFGYTDLHCLEGGVDGWEAAGFEVFSGVNVPSKAFGEFVEHEYDTPRIKPEQLKAMMDAGEKMVVLDSRPMTEYRVMNIPTGIDCPGAELAYRVHDIAPDPDTTVVVNCAGRTRSIIGCQSLRNAGIPNKVVALENGTMGWHLAGFELERGQARNFPEMSDAGRERARACAHQVAERFDVTTVDHATLTGWLDDFTRTTYVLDVRNPEEFEAGHLPGSRHAPGGQLVQAWDRYIAVLGARIVLVCDDGVRSTMTAHWLVQMGWEAHVLEDAFEGHLLEVGAHDPFIPGFDTAAPRLTTVKELAERLAGGDAVVIDLNDSLSYRDAGHIPGAWFAQRAKLPGNLAAAGVPNPGLTALTSPDGVLATLAAGEAAADGREVVVLEGGTDAWKAAGKPLETGFINMADDTKDVWYRPYDLNDDDEGRQEGAMKQYLSWEIDLVHQIERDGTTRFRRFPDN